VEIIEFSKAAGKKRSGKKRHRETDESKGSSRAVTGKAAVEMLLGHKETEVTLV
jgi:hypothetical protein